MALEKIDRIGEYTIERDTVTRRLYVSWREPASGRRRRRSLKTRDVAQAFTMVRSMVGRHVGRVPDDNIQTVDELLDWYLCSSCAAANTERGTVAHLKYLLGGRRLGALTSADFKNFHEICLAEGLPVTIVKRAIATLRSASRRAVE